MCPERGDDSSAEAVGMPWRAAEDVPVCLDLRRYSKSRCDQKEEEEEVNFSGRTIFECSDCETERPYYMNRLLRLCYKNEKTKTSVNAPKKKQMSNITNTPMHKRSKQRNNDNDDGDVFMFPQLMWEHTA